MMKRATAALLLSVTVFWVSGSGRSSAASTDQQQYNDYRTQGADNPAGGSLSFTFGRGVTTTTTESRTDLGVNAYLWRSSLDTLSFMPLAAADPFGGKIVTEWYTPPGITGERFKATVYIAGRALRSDGIRVSILRQINVGAGWQDGLVAASTIAGIEERIFIRAQELEAAAKTAG